MKVYAVAGKSEDVKTLTAFCQENGWSLKVMNSFGRPRDGHPVDLVFDAFRAAPSIRAAARKLNMPPATVHSILKKGGCLGGK